MPLFHIDMSANAQLFFAFIMQISSFDILPTNDFYDKYFPSPAWDGPINEKLDILGF